MSNRIEPRRIRVGVLFGGQSGEHAVSLASANSVIACIDRTRYEPVPIGITPRGDWLIGGDAERLLAGKTSDESERFDGERDVPTQERLIPISGSTGQTLMRDGTVDVMFPVLHGPFGEDGTVQGLLRMAGIPFVGSDVLGSALAMDKGYMKDRFAFLGLPQAAYSVFTRREITATVDAVAQRIEDQMRYPVFIKPCNLGSSVGISKARHRSALEIGLLEAANHDGRIIVEQGIDAREVECGVLGNDDPQISEFGEVESHHDWYDFASKYTEGLADLRIPAPLTPQQRTQGQRLARQAFRAVGAMGLARVDFFVQRHGGNLLVNEINTMPGFTRTSMYPKVWEASGVPYTELISRLLTLALERHEEQRSFGPR